ncbi:hypothetical protein GCM10010178_90770 [Lentzea flava]|uniref:Uncharacterized protein n=1 Tax=Lentzea flava TaxID=103732 RepID=A0ABQ2VH01_9PSEU|nr:hypothetical protein GCM10010178_90770 [Lentzea flava]
MAVLLAQMAFTMVTAAVEQTPTIDEPVYVLYESGNDPGRLLLLARLPMWTPRVRGPR